MRIKMAKKKMTPKREVRDKYFILYKDNEVYSDVEDENTGVCYPADDLEVEVFFNKKERSNTLNNRKMKLKYDVNGTI